MIPKAAPCLAREEEKAQNWVKFDASSDFEFYNLCWVGIESSVKLKWAPDLELTQLN